MSESELDAWFPRSKPVDPTILGAVVSGSLSKGLEAKLSPDRPHRRAGGGPLRRRARADGAPLLRDDHRRDAGEPPPGGGTVAAGGPGRLSGAGLSRHTHLRADAHHTDAGGRRWRRCGLPRPSPRISRACTRPRRKRSPRSSAIPTNPVASTSASRWRWRARASRWICRASSNVPAASSARAVPARPSSRGWCWRASSRSALRST